MNTGINHESVIYMPSGLLRAHHAEQGRRLDQVLVDLGKLLDIVDKTPEQRAEIHRLDEMMQLIVEKVDILHNELQKRARALEAIAARRKSAA